MSRVRLWDCGRVALGSGQPLLPDTAPLPQPALTGPLLGAGAGWCPLCLLQLLLNFTLGSVISPTTSSLFD